MPKIKVKVANKSAERFFRCGMEFTQEWQEVDVDEATAQRLREEQMLAVAEADVPELENLSSEEVPTGAAPEGKGADTQTASDDPAPVGPAPADPAPAPPTPAKKVK
jgi:hypothetical protein